MTLLSYLFDDGGVANEDDCHIYISLLAQWAVPRSWASALIVGYHTNHGAHSHPKVKDPTVRS